jgi:hypothetical protein
MRRRACILFFVAYTLFFVAYTLFFVAYILSIIPSQPGCPVYS